MGKPNFYYISLPKNKERCIEIFHYLSGRELPVFTETKYNFAWYDETGIYFTENLPGNGGEEVKLTIQPFQKVVHFRSGRVEIIEKTALVKTEDGSWKEAVIYGDGVKTFVRELENFKEAFINK